MIPIRGDVVGIERANGRTEVIVEEPGGGRAAYALDAPLVDLGAALEARDFARAVETLESLPPPQGAGGGGGAAGAAAGADAQWRALEAAALEAGDLAVAERCAAALGDVARATYLKALRKAAERQRPAAGAGAALSGAGGGADALPVGVRARLAALARQWPAAEALLLAQGRAAEAVELYREAGRWDDAVRVADASRHPGAGALRAAHLEWLLATGQEARAGALKEKEGDVAAAARLYLKGGAPARAARVLTAAPAGTAPPPPAEPALLAVVEAALAAAGLHERRGDLLLRLARPRDALVAFQEGRAYRKAVDLARASAPDQVTRLEEEWGDWLLAERRAPEAAVAHFVEAGRGAKAVEAALAARQFGKAAGEWWAPRAVCRVCQPRTYSLAV